MKKMSKSKAEIAGRSLLRRVRRQRVKYIAILPSLVTIINGVCGFTAIILASRGAELGAGPGPGKTPTHFFMFGAANCFAMSGYMILVAMVADMIDGRLARKVKSTSSFGGQLDSLCDVISFGVAPAFLMVKVLESVGAANETFVQRSIWLAAVAYMSCAIIRLARFNVENEEDESAHMSFMGLPTPAAAGVVVSLVILHQEELPTVNAIVYALPFLALGMAALMVSRVRYPHVVNQYLRGKKPFAHLIRVLLLLALVWWLKIKALAIIFCGFAASSFIRWFYIRVQKLGFPAQWHHKIIHNEDDLIPATPHSAFTAGDESDVDN